MAAALTSYKLTLCGIDNSDWFVRAPYPTRGEHALRALSCEETRMGREVCTQKASPDLINASPDLINARLDF